MKWSERFVDDSFLARAGPFMRNWPCGRGHASSSLGGRRIAMASLVWGIVGIVSCSLFVIRCASSDSV